MQLEQIQALIATEMKAVDKAIQQRLKSDVVLIRQLGHYIINSGGKRLRPQLLLLAARATAYKGQQHIELAAIIEFIHTATLLHDDVVDASNMRRGRDSANAVWGNEAAVLVGDFLYSRAFEMMVEIGSMPIMALLAGTTNAIAEGEVLQLLNVHDPDTSEQTYLDVIRRKTAKLFEAATTIGALLADLDAEKQQAMAAYGMHLGCAFQLIDDVLDYSASSEELGKNLGDDLAEGKPTLPLIYALQQGTAEQAAVIRTAIEDGGLEQVDEIQKILLSTGAIEYTRQLATDEAQRAKQSLDSLHDSEAKQALLALSDYAVQRKH